MEFALEGERSTLSSLAKLTVGCMLFTFVPINSSSFWGLFWRAWGPFGVLLAPRGAQDDSGLHFFVFRSLFFVFYTALGTQGAPKGAPRTAKATNMVPRVVPKGAKSAPERVFS